MEIPVYAAVLTNMYVASGILTHTRSRSIHTITAEVNVEEGEGPGDRCSYSLNIFCPVQVYSLSEDDDQCFFSCDISRQSDWLVVGQKDGSVVQLDPRGKYSVVVY